MRKITSESAVSIDYLVGLVDLRRKSSCDHEFHEFSLQEKLNKSINFKIFV